MRGLSKKGQVSSLAPAIITLLIAAVFLVFGVIILESVKDTSTLKNSVAVTNEFPAFLNQTGYTFLTEKADKTSGFTVSVVKNATTAGLGFYNLTIPTANYTVDATNGIIRNATTQTYTNVSINYTYEAGEDAWDASNKTLSGIGTFADFWEIIVLAIVITLIIGLLLVTFARRGQR